MAFDAAARAEEQRFARGDVPVHFRLDRRRAEAANEGDEVPNLFVGERKRRHVRSGHALLDGFEQLIVVGASDFAAVDQAGAAAAFAVRSVAGGAGVDELAPATAATTPWPCLPRRLRACSRRRNRRRLSAQSESKASRPGHYIRSLMSICSPWATAGRGPGHATGPAGSRMMRPPARLSVWDFRFGHPNASIIAEHSAPAQRFSAFSGTSDLLPPLSAAPGGVMRRFTGSGGPLWRHCPDAAFHNPVLRLLESSLRHPPGAGSASSRFSSSPKSVRLRCPSASNSQ